MTRQPTRSTTRSTARARSARSFTGPQVAMMCGVEVATVRQWIRRGHLDRGPDGRIAGSAVLAYLDRRGGRGQHAS